MRALVQRVSNASVSVDASVWPDAITCESSPVRRRIERTYASAVVRDTASVPMRLPFDVGHADREAGDVRLELDTLLLGIPEGQRDVRRLDFGPLVRALRNPEHVPVELDRPLDVTRRDRDEVDLLDLHQGLVPSE